MVKPSYLREMYKEVKKDIRDYSDRQWETVKFFTYIFIALITVYVTLISIIGFSNVWKIMMISVIIPPGIFIFSVMGWRTFRRECARLFECIAIIKKIEEKIDFYDKRESDKKVLKGDNYYLSDRMVNLNEKIDTTEKFVDMMINFKKAKKEHSLECNIQRITDRYGDSYSCFKWIFFVYCCLSIATIIIVLIISLKIV